MAGQQDPDAGGRRRHALIAWSAVGLVAAVAFGLLLWGVLAHDGLTRADPSVATFVGSHRLAWLTTVMQVATWLGSSFVIIPLVVAAGGVLWLRRRRRRPLVTLTAAFLGAAALYDIVKPAAGRTRPPAALQVGGQDEGWAFPSGHANAIHRLLRDAGYRPDRLVCTTAPAAFRDRRRARNPRGGRVTPLSRRPLAHGCPRGLCARACLAGRRDGHVCAPGRPDGLVETTLADRLGTRGAPCQG